MGTMLKYGSEGAKSFYDKYVIPPHIAKAHADGQIHIHDKDFYTLTETCCQIDLIKLFHNGFSTGHGYLREPNDIRSYAALACIAIQANQNEMHGGQSVPIFDYAMAQGVDKTYRKEYFKALVEFLQVQKAMPYGDVKAMIDAAKADLGDQVTMTTRRRVRPALCRVPPPPPAGERLPGGHRGGGRGRRRLRQRDRLAGDRQRHLPGPWRPWCTT